MRCSFLLILCLLVGCQKEEKRENLELVILTNELNSLDVKIQNTQSFFTMIVLEMMPKRL